jgi:hypothetical protein
MIPDLDSKPLVVACGGELEARIEESHRDDRVDHVWITMDCGFQPRVLVSVNTRSLRNAEEGFDARVRVGMVRGENEHLPPRGMMALTAFDYADVEAQNNVFYETKTREEMELLLFHHCEEAVVLQAWGAPYRRRKHPGLHQIHSRRASCAVATDLQGLDGGLRFFYRDATGIRSVTLLMKFCGQP